VATGAAEQVRMSVPNGGGAAIAVANVDVTYGVGGAEPVKALTGISLDVPDGAFVRWWGHRLRQEHAAQRSLPT